jgi:hypothetical protein
MNTLLRRRSKAATTVVLGLIVATTTLIAGATPLPPGAMVFPTGTTYAADPTLGGTVYNTLFTPFDCGGGLKGTLYAFVLQNSASYPTMDFYYRVSVDSGATEHVRYVNVTDFTNGLNVDVNYRTDGIGNSAPKAVSRSADGKEVSFYFSEFLGPGDTSYSLLVRGGRKWYSDAGTVTISNGSGIRCTVPGSFQPAL